MNPISFTSTGPARRRVAHCSFCGKSQHEVARMCGGPGSHESQPFVCSECSALAERLVAEGKYSHGPQSCSFCAKRREQVQGLIAAGASPGVSMCDECVALVQEMFHP